MAFWIAAATLAGSAYQADRARKTAKEARLAAEREAAVTQSQTQQQIEIQQQQAGIAKERLSAETAKYAEQKGAMDCITFKHMMDNRTCTYFNFCYKCIDK
jgi:hypothetical protein